MKNKKRSIRFSLLTGCVVFICLMCLALSLQSYLLISDALYRRYDSKLKEVVTYVSHKMDADDMRECINTGTKSPTYQRTQAFLNELIDEFDLAYLYTLIPGKKGSNSMTNVISATSAAERARGETDLPLLLVSKDYSSKEVAKYADAFGRKDISYFEETSDYGTFYTACKPLVTTDGETIALICADISVDDLHKTVTRHVLLSVLTIVLIGVLTGISLSIWLQNYISTPILELEKSVREYAEKNHESADFSELTFDSPDIHTGNEIETLADSIVKMSEDMKNYFEAILIARERAEHAEKEAESLTTIAYQDPLTHVKSKAAYDMAINALNKEVKQGQTDFAMVMIDLNDLKKVNDKWGHEHGNDYIIGACGIICKVFKHSPVFRIGGDEFAVILKGQDYENRNDLFSTLTRLFHEAHQNMSSEPWERYSAAAGMANYTKDENETVESVFRRADRMMYINKKYIKYQAP